MRSQISVIIISIFLSGLAHAQGPPRLPAHPQSESDCEQWTIALNNYWEEAVLKQARSLDAKCRADYKGAYKTVQSDCGNTTAQVTHQTPCHTASYYGQCDTIQAVKGLEECRRRLATSKANPNQPSGAQAPKPDDQVKMNEVSLDEQDVAFIQRLAKQDEFIRKLSASAVGSKFIGQIVGWTVQGPAKLVVQWDQALLKGWVEANKGLALANQYEICQEITEHFLETKAVTYFDELYKARGCQQ
jgi:hypothetical protein